MMAVTQNATPLVIAEMPDADLLGYYAGVREQREAIVADLTAMEGAIKTEIMRRMKERDAREIADPRFAKIAIEPVWSQYTYDLDALRQAAALLRAAGKDEESAKVLKHVPQRIEVVEAHDEPGAPVSINALIKKYGESDIGLALCAAISRVQLDEKLVIQAAKGMP